MEEYMDSFITTIKLKKHVTKETIFDLIKMWLKNSPHYNIEEINYCFKTDYFEQNFDNYKINIISKSINDEEVFACRFINKEETKTWVIDYIFTEKQEDKKINIKTIYKTNQYSSSLPKYNKPHIIKMLFEQNFCSDEGVFPVTDKAIKLSDEHLKTCADIMLGKQNTDLPIVYVSYDSYNKNHYALDYNKLATELSGMAIVLVEPNKDFALKLRECVHDNNAYNGFIGIYFPNTTYKEIIPFTDYDKLTIKINTIINAVRQAALNHANFSDSWENLLIQYHKYKNEQQNNDDEAILKLYEEEKEQMQEKINSLQTQLNNKTAQLDSLSIKYSHSKAITINIENIQEFFPNEIKDCILTSLKQYFNKNGIPNNTRTYEILNSVLQINELSCTGKAIYKEIKDALNSKSLDERRKRLKNCGFEVSQGPHDKVKFHNDKYTFSISNSPSDHRNNDNLFSDMMKVIDIYKDF